MVRELTTKFTACKTENRFTKKKYNLSLKRPIFDALGKGKKYIFFSLIIQKLQLLFPSYFFVKAPFFELHLKCYSKNSQG